ncbi:Uncharacterised protein [Mycobacterium tuberculosis]|nr:Uncharacterised protein [Mycobacterium tuberculosis]
MKQFRSKYAEGGIVRSPSSRRLIFLAECSRMNRVSISHNRSLAQ